MVWTKRQLVLKAYEELALGNGFDIPPEAIQSGCVSMDGMVNSWIPRISISYPTTSGPDSVDVNTEVNVPANAYPAIWLNLALWIAPTFGKTPSLETTKRASAALKSLELSQLSAPLRKVACGLPVGSGNKPWQTGIEYIHNDNCTIRRTENGDDINFN